MSMSDSQKSSAAKVASKTVKPMAALQGYLDDMLAVATSTAAAEEVSTQVETKTVTETEIKVQETSIQTADEPEIVTEPSSEVVIAEDVRSVPTVTPALDTVTDTLVETSEVLVESPVVAMPEIETVTDTEIETTIEPEVALVESEPEIVVDQAIVADQDIALEPAVEPVPTVAPTETTTPAEAEVETVTTTQNELSQRALSPEGVELAYPQWAASGFECLLFYVGGIKLAVPLILLGGIHRIEQELTPLFGQPDWFLGLFPRKTMDGQQNIRVVHTAKWVMPEKQCAEVDPLNHYVISLGDSEWGLLSHQLSDSIRLMPDQVKWRTSAGKRPWLAGTVIDHMCAILDVNSLVELLNKNSKRLS